MANDFLWAKKSVFSKTFRFFSEKYVLNWPNLFFSGKKRTSNLAMYQFLFKSNIFANFFFINENRQKNINGLIIFAFAFLFRSTLSNITVSNTYFHDACFQHWIWSILWFINPTQIKLIHDAYLKFSSLSFAWRQHLEFLRLCVLEWDVPSYLLALEIVASIFQDSWMYHPTRCQLSWDLFYICAETIFIAVNDRIAPHHPV